MSGEPRVATAAELDGWDRRVVQAPGGHVYQSTVWAAQRARLGWTPLHVMLDDDHAALVLTRPWPLIGGASAYVPRGPISAGGTGALAAARVVALAGWLASRGVDVVASDAEIPAADGSYRDVLASAGFQPISEIQPSRHRMSLALARHTDDTAVLAGLAKSTRQRVNAAERDGIAVHRYDTAGWVGRQPLFERPGRTPDAALGEFATLLEGTGERRGFRFGPRQVFLDWWRAAHDAGMLIYLEATETTEATAGARALGGLILYRHGGRLSTVHSADAPGVRDTHPGVMHLLRWRAIQLAIREGCTEMDLGGVDVYPDHEEPREGDPTFGLYEHKRSFGATWVSMTGAQELTIRPWRYHLGRVTSAVVRGVRR